MKYIQLSKGKRTKVDNEDFGWLSQWKWTYMKGYAIRCVGGRKNKKTLYMHREILKTPENLFTDHIDHNGLNNQKSNLRVVNKSLNMLNCKIPKDNTSGFKGVRKVIEKHKYKDKVYEYSVWRSEITINGKTKLLGKYKDINEAYKARLKAEKRLWKKNSKNSLTSGTGNRVKSTIPPI